MTNQEAKAVVAQLAAFYRERIPAATFDLWAEELEHKRSYPAAMDAVRALSREQDRMPPLSILLDEYQRHVDKHAPPALPEPELTPEQVKDNLRKARVLLAQVEGNISLDEALQEVVRDGA